MIRSWWHTALALAGGMIWADWTRGSWLTALPLLIALGIGLYAKADKKIIVLTLCFALGFFNYGLRTQAPPPGLVNLPEQSMSGIVKDLKLEADRFRFNLVNPEAVWLLEKIRVSGYFPASLQEGDLVRLQGTPQVPREPRNPGDFDYPAYLAGAGVFYTVSLSKAEQLELLQKGDPGIIESFREEIRTLLPQRFSPREAGLILGMVLGDTDTMPEEDYELFQAVGIVHLLSVSGFHVILLLAAVHFLLRWLKLGKRSQFAVCSLILLFYGTLTGWPPPVQRSILMALLGMTALYFGRIKSGLDILGLAGVIILLINPSAITGLSFQLSFLATWGLLYLYPILRRRWVNPAKWVDLLIIPLAAQLATWPLVVYHFNLFSPVALLANVGTAYLAGIIVVLGLVGILLLPLLPFLAQLILYPAAWAGNLLLEVTNILYRIPGGYMWLKTPSVWLIGLYYTLLVGVFYLLTHPQCLPAYQLRLISGSAGLTILSIIWLLLPYDLWNHELKLTFIDVGQGDCLLIKTPQGRYALLDGGGSEFYPVGERVTLPYLRRQGIRHLDWIFSSHPDLDHWQGLVTVLNSLKVDYLGIPYNLWMNQEYEAARSEFPGVQWAGLHAGQRFQLDDTVRISVLYPDRQTPADDVNESSLVFYLEYGDFSAWLGGDIGKPGLNRMLKAIKLHPVTLVKVPHHGSKNSLLPELYDQLQPGYAVVQAGVDNRYGHPHPEVLAELDSRGVKLINSQESGLIQFYTDGQSLRVQTFLP